MLETKAHVSIFTAVLSLWKQPMLEMTLSLKQRSKNFSLQLLVDFTFELEVGTHMTSIRCNDDDYAGRNLLWAKGAA